MIFIVAPTRFIIILLLLKLLKIEQNVLINYLFYKKLVILISNNNQKSIKCKIANENYIHVFTSFKIVFSKNFKKNILNNLFFIVQLFFLAIDKIYLNE